MTAAAPLLSPRGPPEGVADVADPLALMPPLPAGGRIPRSSCSWADSLQRSGKVSRCAFTSLFVTSALTASWVSLGHVYGTLKLSKLEWFVLELG